VWVKVKGTKGLLGEETFNPGRIFLPLLKIRFLEPGEFNPLGYFWGNNGGGEPFLFPLFCFKKITLLGLELKGEKFGGGKLGNNNLICEGFPP